MTKRRPRSPDVETTTMVVELAGKNMRPKTEEADAGTVSMRRMIEAIGKTADGAGMTTGTDTNMRRKSMNMSMKMRRRKTIGVADMETGAEGIMIEKTMAEAAGADAAGEIGRRDEVKSTILTRRLRKKRRRRQRTRPLIQIK